MCRHGGGDQFAKLNTKGFLVTLPSGAGMPCQGCFQTGRDLKLRYYRRVVRMLFADHVYVTAGYFCRGCRWRQLGKHLGLTLVLGWWGIIALYFRNPYVIVTNLWALVAAPFGAGPLGALNVNEIRAEADEEQRLADAYNSMPSWFEDIDEDEIDLILADTDYYEALGVRADAPPEQIKSAYREQVKRHHPDVAGAASHDQMVFINDAYRVLGDARLRHAFDHQDDLLEFFGRVREHYGHGNGDAQNVADEPPDMTGYHFGCAVCRAAFMTFDDYSEHLRAEHPGTGFITGLVMLRDGVPVDDESLSNGHPADTDGWRCKSCREVFGDYQAALGHADAAHPERVAVDVRMAVEPA